MKTIANIAIIPTGQSALYDAFGLDLGVAAVYDEDGVCIRAFRHLEWREAADFPRYKDGGAEADLADREVRWTLEDLAPEYRFDWGTLDYSAGEYATVSVEAL